MLHIKIAWALIAVLAVASAMFGTRNIGLQSELSQARAQLAQSATNGQVLEFMQAFVDKVLRAKGEVSFDDRLQLENMVRELHDDAILAAWNKFVNSQTSTEAQEEVKNLLELLVHKMRA